MAKKAFINLKKVVNQLLALALPIFIKTFLIKSDALNEGIEACSIQEGRLIPYYNKVLKGKEIVVSIYEKEWLVIVLAIKK